MQQSRQENLRRQAESDGRAETHPLDADTRPSRSWMALGTREVTDKLIAKSLAKNFYPWQRKVRFPHRCGQDRNPSPGFTLGSGLPAGRDQRAATWRGRYRGWRRQGYSMRI
jgi:hypothetical protein